MTASTFVYSPLDTESQEIRLLQVLPAASNEIIRCTLKVANIFTFRRYKALSYTWGPATPTKEILVNGKRFIVRRNLWEFLVVAREKYPNDRLWVDQICIDQSSIEEKNHQIPFISRIYRDAITVFMWLGPTADDSDLAIDCLSSRPHTDEYWRVGRSQVYRDYFKTLTDQNVLAMRALFARPYWNRLWVIQEIGLACKVVVLCGSEQIYLEAVKSFVMVSTWFGEGIVGSGAKTLLTADIPADLLHNKEHMDTCDRMSVSNTFDGIPRYHLTRLVYKYCHFQCADPRDKIYGFLGLATELGMQNKRHAIQANYGKSVVDVFWEFFATHLSELLGYYRLNICEILEDWLVFGILLTKQMGIYSSAMEKAIREFLQAMYHDHDQRRIR